MFFKNILKAFRVLSALLEWQAVALEDGKITIDEIVMLVKKISEIFGFPVAFVVPDKLAKEVLGVTLVEDQVLIE